jgi:hypothetical protein
MFTLVGLILSVYGFSTEGSAIYAKSLNINANLDWGLVLLVFGTVMFLLGRRGQRKTDLESRKVSPGGKPTIVRRGGH